MILGGASVASGPSLSSVLASSSSSPSQALPLSPSVTRRTSADMRLVLVDVGAGRIIIILINFIYTLCVGGWWVFIVSYALHLLILGSCYTAHQRIVNIMKVYIKRNNIQVELMRFRKNSDFIDVWNFEVGIYFHDRRAHCYPWRVATGLSHAGCAGRFGTCPIRNIVTSEHVISRQARYGTAQLHYFKSLRTDSSHGKSVQAPIRL